MLEYVEQARLYYFQLTIKLTFAMTYFRFFFEFNQFLMLQIFNAHPSVKNDILNTQYFLALIQLKNLYLTYIFEIF